MRARLVVFPVRGRNWCFSRSIDPSAADVASSNAPSTLRELWGNISSSKSTPQRAELLVDYVSNKMNFVWKGLEKAPEGSLKNKFHGLGLKLLARVKPSEIFLKSISKEVSSVEITYPSSLNPRLVRRRLRHISMRGAAIHKKYLYGSFSLLPLTSAFSVLPLPNIPFFWLLFRTYSHWRGLQGSEKLLRLVSDHPQGENSAASTDKGSDSGSEDSEPKLVNSQGLKWVLHPSKELEELVRGGYKNDDGLSKCAISKICKTYKLNTDEVLKFRNAV